MQYNKLLFSFSLIILSINQLNAMINKDKLYDLININNTCNIQTTSIKSNNKKYKNSDTKKYQGNEYYALSNITKMKLREKLQIIKEYPNAENQDENDDFNSDSLHSSSTTVSSLETNDEQRDFKTQWYEKLDKDSIKEFKSQISNDDIEDKFFKLLFNINDNTVNYSDSFLNLLQDYNSYESEYLNDIYYMLSQESIQSKLNESFKYKNIDNLNDVYNLLKNKKFVSDKYKLIYDIVDLTLFNFNSFTTMYYAMYDEQYQNALDEFVKLIKDKLLFELYIRNHNDVYNLRDLNQILIKEIKNIKLTNNEKNNIVSLLGQVSRCMWIQEIIQTLFHS
ncbi:MAG: hypothetical protein IJ848_03915 [Alphaproteobacteria bacterium]|nr:hypothetical protein [Alphaproteobacteria bacterium]